MPYRAKFALTYFEGVVSEMDMRYLCVDTAISRIVRALRPAIAFAAACALWSAASTASADTVYRWRDDADRLHFSNRAEQAPSHAKVMSLPPLGIAKGRPLAADRSSFAESLPADEDRSVEAPSGFSGCDGADPGPLIDAITSRLESMRSDGRADPGLTLFVGGTPVSHSPNAIVQVFAADETDGTTASEQAAIAYPADGGCPSTPPLERYAVTSFAGTSSPGLCAAYRRAFAEIDIAIGRNENVAHTFEVVAAGFDAPAADEERPTTAAQKVELPPWLVEASAAQTAELAAETEEFVEELTVAREEIDRAAQAQGCW